MRCCVKSKEEKEEDKGREGGTVRKKKEKGEWEIMVGCACKVSFYVCLVRSNPSALFYQVSFLLFFLSSFLFFSESDSDFSPKGCW